MWSPYEGGQLDRFHCIRTLTRFWSSCIVLRVRIKILFCLNLLDLIILIIKCHYFIWQLLAAIPFQLAYWINVPDSADSQQARRSSDGKWQTMLVRYNKAPVLSGGYKSLGSSLCIFLHPRHFLPLSACVPPLPSDFLDKTNRGLQFARTHSSLPPVSLQQHFMSNCLPA